MVAALVVHNYRQLKHDGEAGLNLKFGILGKSIIN